MENTVSPLFDPNTIRKARIRKYKTVSEFAKKMDVTRNTIYRIENGKEPVSISLLKRVCSELDLAFQILIYPTE